MNFHRKFLFQKIILMFSLTFFTHSLFAQSLAVETAKANSIQKVSLKNGVLTLQGPINNILLTKIFKVLVENSRSTELRNNFQSMDSSEKADLIKQAMEPNFPLTHFPFPTLDNFHSLKLHSTGGDLIPTEKIIEIVEYVGLNTVVPINNICYSACALIFSSGNLRQAGENSLLMFHGVKREYIDGTPCSRKKSHEYCESIGDANIVNFANSKMETYLPRNLYLKVRAGREVTIPTKVLMNMGKIHRVEPCLKETGSNSCNWTGYQNIRIR